MLCSRYMPLWGQMDWIILWSRHVQENSNENLWRQSAWLLSTPSCMNSNNFLNMMKTVGNHQAEKIKADIMMSEISSSPEFTPIRKIIELLTIYLKNFWFKTVPINKARMKIFHLKIIFLSTAKLFVMLVTKKVGSVSGNTFKNYRKLGLM